MGEQDHRGRYEEDSCHDQGSEDEVAQLAGGLVDGHLGGRLVKPRQGGVVGMAGHRCGDGEVGWHILIRAPWWGSRGLHMGWRPIGPAGGAWRAACV